MTRVARRRRRRAAARGRAQRRGARARIPLDAVAARRPRSSARPSSSPIGLNYADHVAEAGIETPKLPGLFNKQSTCVVGPARPDAPAARLAGARLRGRARLRDRTALPARAARARARGDRRLPGRQRRDACATGSSASPTMTMGKSFDTHGPIGPWIVTADEVGDPHALRAPHLGERRAAPGLEHQEPDLRLLRAGRAPLDGVHARARRRGRDRHAGRRRRRDEAAALLAAGDVVRDRDRAGSARSRTAVDRRARRHGAPSERGGRPHGTSPPPPITIGVPDVDAGRAFYSRASASRETARRRFATADGGEQLRLVAGAAPPPARARRRRRRRRRPRRACGQRSRGLGVARRARDATRLDAVDPGTRRARRRRDRAARRRRRRPHAPRSTRPGSAARSDARRRPCCASDPVRPRKLGHVVARLDRPRPRASASSSTASASR